MLGINFDTKHSYHDWGVLLEDTHISPPLPKRYIVDVPARNGILDLTPELTPIMRYETRTLTVTFRVKAGGWSTLMSVIYGEIHGKTMDIISDLDPDWHWHGFVTVDDFSSDERTGVLVIKAEVNPFKLSNIPTVLEIDGDGELNCFCERMEVNPTITVTDNATIEFNDSSVALEEGTYIVNDFLFLNGNNILTVTSEGTTTVTYTNGRL